MSSSDHNPCIVRIETPAGAWRVDVLELGQAVERDPGDVAGVFLRMGCPGNLSASDALAVMKSLRAAEREILGRQQWMMDLFDFYRPVNPWTLPEWQCRLLYADLPRRRAIQALEDARRLGKTLTLDSHFDLLARAYGEDEAERMMNRAGRFDEGLPKKLLERDAQAKQRERAKDAAEQ